MTPDATTPAILEERRRILLLLAHLFLGVLVGSSQGILSGVVAFGVWPHPDARHLIFDLFWTDPMLLNEALGLGIMLGGPLGAILGMLSCWLAPSIGLRRKWVLGSLIPLPFLLFTWWLGPGASLFSAPASAALFLGVVLIIEKE